jgi:hypothetical protein
MWLRGLHSVRIDRCGRAAADEKIEFPVQNESTAMQRLGHVLGWAGNLLGIPLILVGVYTLTLPGGATDAAVLFFVLPGIVIFLLGRALRYIFAGEGTSSNGFTRARLNTLVWAAIIWVAIAVALNDFFDVPMSHALGAVAIGGTTRLESLLKANAAPRCGARSKRTGKPCRGAAMPNGRCKLHGGKRTFGAIRQPHHLADNELELLTCAPMGADARAAALSCDFRTFQVYPKDLRALP